jgi:hypothetical protein
MDNVFTSMDSAVSDTVGIENMVEDSVSGICSVVTSDIAMEAASDTPVIADLIPNAVYNLYTMRSSTAEVPFSAENLLYIGQGTTSADGSLAIDYEPKEVDESAITFAVCMEQYDIMDAETNMHDLVYTGEEQIPLFDVTYHGSTLTEGVDYRVSGDISATDAGNYTITITGMGLYSGRKEVSYQILSSATKVAKITLNSSSTTLGVGKDITLKATITPTDAANQEVTWTSSDEKVATVDEDGKVTAVAAGTATITCTATDGSGVSATCEVTVTEVESPEKPWVFDDVTVNEGNWKYEAVKYVYENGYMTGTGDTTFDPDKPLTRGMVVTVLYRMAGSPDITYTGTYSDVKAGKYYAKAVAWAAKNGIATGYSDGTFGAEKNISRQELAKMICQFAKLQGHETTETTDISGYVDYSKVSGYASKYMQWAVATNLISGKKKSGTYYLDPKGEATRAECAAILQRYEQYYEK